MNIYVSTFISGLQEPIIKFLSEDLPDARILNIYDGLVVYKTEAIVHKIFRLKYLNNTFLLIKKYSDIKGNSLEQMVSDAAQLKGISKKINGFTYTEGIKQFRIITSRENQLTPIRRDLLSKMEQALSRLEGFKVNRAKPDYEFWFLSRSEGVGFFMLRLTKLTSKEKTLHKGELKPALSHILCRMSEPDKDDIILDPFCGYGAIPLERAKISSYNMIFMSDKAEEQVKYCKDKVKQLNKKNQRDIIVRRADALSMNNFDDGFINKIITDPPWGYYENLDVDVEELYGSMIKELDRVLKKDGIIIILTAQKDALESSLSRYKESLRISERYHILVSGKKAGVYKIVK